MGVAATATTDQPRIHGSVCGGALGRRRRRPTPRLKSTQLSVTSNARPSWTGFSEDAEPMPNVLFGEMCSAITLRLSFLRTKSIFRQSGASRPRKISQDEVRKVDSTLKASVGSFIKVPFDLDHWKLVASKRYPKGLPRPYSGRSYSVDLSRPPVRFGGLG